MHITTSQLDTIEQALKLGESWDKALEVVAEVRQNVASAALLQRARDKYQDDDIEIDDDAGTSPYDDGCWVSAWVHLRKSTRMCEVCQGHGSVGPLGAPAPQGTTHYFATYTCGNCRGVGKVMIEFGEEDR